MIRLHTRRHGNRPAKDQRTAVDSTQRRDLLRAVSRTQSWLRDCNAAIAEAKRTNGEIPDDVFLDLVARHLQLTSDQTI